ncbi:hypothetical protein [Streptomyces hyaluromycini]|uniref:hypothetical protein n=1 Tax=Streptomyces hyaluromycini TaxID=1377993 RepID=UPI0011AEA0CE|nr:hypothetical protein [Streptomyces hyaluromycini]
MADDSLFAALPDNIKRGGDLTDQVADIVKNHLSRYGDHYIDPNDPSIGEPTDETVHAILRDYSPAYNQTVQALGQVNKALLKASELTTASGVDFDRTQQDALDKINSGNSRRLP